jgi:Kdo2-lipid IVA lauroyltransferase/acyltransferase
MRSQTFKIYFIHFIVNFLAMLPFTFAQWLGRTSGILLYISPNPLRRVVRCNIENCFPHYSKKEQNRLIRKSLMTLVCSVAEYGAWWLWPTEKLAPLLKEVVGKEALDEAQKAGKGVVLLVPHLGAWEIAQGYMPTRYKCGAMYRPLRIPAIDEFVKKARQRGGSPMLPLTPAGMREAYARLERGEMIAVLPDQVPGKKSGVFAPFFGMPAWTMTFAIKLARRTNASIFFAYGERLGPGKGFRLHFVPAREEIYDKDVVKAVTAMNADIQAIVEKHPDQYQWVYKRFKVQPEGRENIYSRESA